MKKKCLFILIAVLIIVFVGGRVYMIFFKKANTSENKKDSAVGTFELEAYREEIDDYTKRFPEGNTLEPLGFIDSLHTAKEKAEVVLIKIYGKNTIKNRKPFSVSFDEESQVYLIQGTLPDNVEGGAPHILIQKTDGKVLAVWNYK